MPKYFIRTPTAQSRKAFAPAVEELTATSYLSNSEPDVLIADLKEDDIGRLESEGLEIIPSRQYEPFTIAAADRIFQPLDSHPLGLKDVLRHIKADKAWSQSRGKGVHIAVVDTGICGSLNEFHAAKRSPHSWAAQGLGSPWTDLKGHGSMVAGAAAADSSAQGRYDGVAPESTLIALKTTFDDTELYEIYDRLIGLVDSGQIGRLVINNSYGAYQCTPPNIKVTDPFPKIVSQAIDKGIVVVFAAGNNHVAECGGDANDCSPNTIWGVNSFDDVISVGTVDENNGMDQPPVDPGGYSHRDSSRGPGQFAQRTTKPDCVAPTYGEVIWGCGYSSMQWWGTSGAAPLVSGLAALMLARNPALTPREIQDIIKETCVKLPLSSACAGAGLINCSAAVTRA